MISEVPQFVLRAYALFFTKHGSIESFKQSELDWTVGASMKKKIFSLLLKSGWIKKESRDEYRCIDPNNVFKGLLEFKVPEILKQTEKPYAFTNLSAVEIWSDYSYVQRGIEKSPYFIKVLKKDLNYWQNFFNSYKIPTYLNSGSTIGEYTILVPVEELGFEVKEDIKVEKLKATMQIAKGNNIYLYAYDYMKEKYG